MHWDVARIAMKQKDRNMVQRYCIIAVQLVKEKKSRKEVLEKRRGKEK